MKEPRKDAPEMPESIPTTATLEEFLENDVPDNPSKILQHQTESTDYILHNVYIHRKRPKRL